jgi:uncharacterized membrane protein
MSLLEFLRSLQASPFSISIRESGLFYPLIEGTHVLSLSLSVGMIFWFDLRLTGLTMRGESISGLYRSLRPWIFTGFSLMVTTGVLLFLTRAADVWQNGFFRVKLALLLLALVNVLTYHLLIGKSSRGWDTANTPPGSARVAGFISLLLWFSVVAVGRIMAYNL